MPRLSKDTGPVKRAPETLRKIADAWGLSAEWLLLGRGQPELEQTSPTHVDPYPHRAEAARIAIDGGISEEAVQAVLDEDPQFAEDPSVLWWLHQIEGRALLRELSPVPRSGTRRASNDTKIKK
jgi:hypothetical protein